MKQILSTFSVFLLVLCLSAQIPADYYSSAEMKAGAELKTALHNIIKEGTRLSYGSGTNSTWGGFEKSDRHPNGHVWDMYSTNKVTFPGGGKAGSGMNIEHSFAKSWWGGSKNDAYKDLFHLNPSNSKANSARGSYPLGEIKGEGTWYNGSMKVGYNTFGTEYTERCFEPEDQYKGDFARAYMYMITCYQNLSLTSSDNSRTAIKSDANFLYTFKPWFRDLLLKWHRQDPVSQKEVNRLAEIYKFQDNRNPFIDYPELAEYIWGTMENQIWSSSGSVTEPYITYPYSGSLVEFVSTPVYTTTSDTIIVKARNLEGDLSATISGTDAAAFSIANTTISATDAESAEGAMIIVKFTPNSLNLHNATFTISGGGIAKDVEVFLKGTGSNDFLAVDASSITSSGFTANWSSDFQASSYSLNVFSYVDNGEVGEIEIFNTNFKDESFQDGVSKESGYSNFEDGSLRMGSGSQACIISLPPLDLSSDNVTLSVNAQQYNNDNGAPLYVEVDGNEVGIIETSDEMKSYPINIGSHKSESLVTISVTSGERVFLKDIKIVDKGNILSKDTLEGYPINVGDVLSYAVDISDFSKAYYYNVTSIDGSASTTNTVKVVSSTTSNDNIINQELVWYRNGSVIHINELNGENIINIYSVSGVLIDSFEAEGSASINMGNRPKGVYIVRVQGVKSNQTMKIVY